MTKELFSGKNESKKDYFICSNSGKKDTMEYLACVGMCSSSLLSTPVSRYSSTMPWHVSSMSKIMKEEIHDPKTIVDANACVGNSALLLSACYPRSRIVAIEIDEKTSDCMERNIEKSGAENIVTINDDCLTAIPLLGNIDLLFFDPPWGGKNYYQYDKLDLFLSGQPIEQIVKHCMDSGVISTVVIKVPLNFNFGSFLKALKGFRIKRREVHSSPEKISFYLIFIRIGIK